MNDYTNYEVNDFIYDDFFITWVRERTPESIDFWDKWLLEHPEQQKNIAIAFNIVSGITVNLPKTKLSNEEIASMSAEIALRTSELQNKPRLKIYKQSWTKVAAILLLFISAGLWVYIVKNETTTGIYQQISIEKNLNQAENNSNKPKIVRLSDGSLAILQPGSTLTFPNVFNDKQRVVQLSGEAFFEIAHNKSKPFLVQTKEITTKVLGTSFSVEAFDDDEYAKVSVTTGRVSVSMNKDINQQKSVFLLPNEELTFQQHNTSFKKKQLHSPLPLSTPVIEKTFSFHNAPLAEIIEKLEMAYGVEIQYDKHMYGNMKITASLSDRPLDEKVKLICKAINADCSFPDGMIIIEKEHQ
ncbi:FecR family protein [Pedobacter xixiisoli]|uniref:FecR family protein n=1 Tax=Pedobacter xixiisoli TaxID=1476464 RepID=A0A285ZS54_9SPHI|nr:FecR family protein [Pedobacter xixiisoli]SOD12447.1 FecR family protein [Pedobacter xixiisoli]